MFSVACVCLSVCLSVCVCLRVCLRVCGLLSRHSIDVCYYGIIVRSYLSSSLPLFRPIFFPLRCTSNSSCHSCHSFTHVTLVFQNFECSCPPGFAGDVCEVDFNECASNPCAPAAICLQFSDDILMDDNRLQELIGKSS